MKDGSGGEPTLSPTPHDEGVSYAKKKLKKRNVHHKPASRAAVDPAHLVPGKSKPAANGDADDHKSTMKDAGTLQAMSGGLSREERKVGNYQLMERIGKGGFGTVYRAIEINTGVTVAVKRVDLRNLSRAEVDDIEMEFKLLEDLNHPNIVKYISNIRAFGFLHIILELMENGALTSLLAKLGGQPPEPLLAHYVDQILAGLQYLHAQGVVHRDIKGGNILTDKDGHIKLTDFGIAKKLSENAGFEEAVGTPYWMAPEIIEMAQQSSACDVWSLGCTIIELMTGSPPFHDCDPLAALYKIVTDEIPLPSGITPSLKDFLMECFQKDPNRRVTAAGLRKHPWLRKYLAPQPDKNDSMKIPASILPPKKEKVIVGDDEDWDDLEDSFMTPKQTVTGTTNSSERNETIVSSSLGEKRMARFEEGEEDYDDFADANITETRLKAIHERLEDKVEKEEADPFSEIADDTQDIFDNLDFNDSGDADGQAGSEPGGEKSLAAVLEEFLTDATVLLEKITNTISAASTATRPSSATFSAVAHPVEKPAPEPVRAALAPQQPHTPSEGAEKVKRAIPPPPTHAPPPLVQSLTHSVNQSFIKKISNKFSEMSEKIAADAHQHRTLNAALNNTVAPTTTTPSTTAATTTTTTTTTQPSSLPSATSYPSESPHDSPKSASNGILSSASQLEDHKQRHAFHFSLLCKQLVALIDAAPAAEIKAEIRKLSATPLVESLVKAPRLAPEFLAPLLNTINTVLCTQDGVIIAQKEAALVPPTPSAQKGFSDGPVGFARQRTIPGGPTHVKKSSDVDVKTKNAGSNNSKENNNNKGEDKKPLSSLSSSCSASFTGASASSSPSQHSSSSSSSSSSSLTSSASSPSLPSPFKQLLEDVTKEDTEPEIDPETWSAVCILGLIPASIAYTSGEYTLAVRTEAAQLAQYFCLVHHASFLSCGGLGAMRALLGTPFENNSKHLVLIGLGCLVKVFQSPVPSRNFLARTLSDTLPYVASILLFCQNGKLPEPVMQCVEILGYFSRADPNIKAKLISELVLRPLINALPSLSGEALMGVLRVIHAVSHDTSALRLLEKLGCIKGLVALLEAVMEPPMSEKAKDTQKMLISILVIMCKINPTRLEQAAVAGVIPLMKRVIADQSPLKMFALPMLFNMGKLPHSRVCQAALRKAGGLELYISCLRDFYNRIDALEAIGAWSNNDPLFVETQLLLPSTIAQLCSLFESVTAPVQFERMIRPYKQILNNSDKACIALCEYREGKVIEVIKAKLTKHASDSEIRVGLLHVLTLFYNKHPNTAEFVKRHDLTPLLSEFREKDNSIIVAQLAGRLLARMRLLSVKMRVKNLSKTDKETLGAGDIAGMERQGDDEGD